MQDPCPVCMTNIDEEDSVSMPGCRHKFHAHCMINMVQYDVRCPICRQVGTGVVVREPEFVITAVEVSATQLQERRDTPTREWRRYAARRRRVLRQNPQLDTRMNALKQLRCQMNTNVTKLKKAYDSGCKRVWKYDASVVAYKKQISLLRRRELRLSRSLNKDLEDLLGPEP
jgi:RecJ-like exonuclease